MAETWQRLLRLADELRPEVRLRFLRAMRAASARLTIIQVEEALASGQINRAEQLLAGVLRPTDLSTVSTALHDLFDRAGTLSAQDLNVVIRPDRLRFDVTNPRALQWAESQVGTRIEEWSALTTTERAAIRDVIRQTVAGEQTIRDAAKTLRSMVGLNTQQRRALLNYRLMLRSQGMKSDRVRLKSDAKSAQFLRERAETIARTETLSAVNAGQQEAWLQARELGLITGLERVWIVTPDDRLCFTGDTLVSTESGPRPISAVKCGERVWTHLGLRPVSSVMAWPTRSRLVAVTTQCGRSVATADHPFLVLRARGPEWCLAGSLKQGDLVCVRESTTKSDMCADVVHLRLSDPYDTPTVSTQEGGFSIIPGLVTVPVLAVDFQGDLVPEEKEIHAVAPDFSLLGKLDSSFAERCSDRGLQHVLAVESSVAGEATELPLDLLGLDSELSLTLPTLPEQRRSATNLRTKLRVSTLVTESLAAPWTIPVGGHRPSAFERAHGVSVSDDSWYQERLRADRTDLLNLLALATLQVTRPATESSVPQVVSALGAESTATAFTNEVIGILPASGVVADGRTEFGPVMVDWLATPDAFLSHHSIVSIHTVYSLEISDAHTFFAGGVLVHNCPRCARLDAQRRSLEDEFVDPLTGQSVAYPPLHPRCRCTTGLVSARTSSVRRAA